MKLYEIKAEYLGAIAVLEDSELPQDVIDDTLEGMQGDLNDKVLAVGAFVLNVDTDIKTLKDHKAIIDAKIKALSNRNDSLREYLRMNMEACGITKIESTLFNVSLGKPSKIVSITSQANLDSKYIKTVTTSSPIKADIAKALKAGESVEGAELIDGKSRLTIK